WHTVLLAISIQQALGCKPPSIGQCLLARGKGECWDLKKRRLFKEANVICTLKIINRAVAQMVELILFKILLFGIDVSSFTVLVLQVMKDIKEGGNISNHNPGKKELRLLYLTAGILHLNRRYSDEATVNLVSKLCLSDLILGQTCTEKIMDDSVARVVGM
ncbi:unnamed protein product, partial [Timema podura]|nr:unnamed protein product [Timema podura]